MKRLKRIVPLIVFLCMLFTLPVNTLAQNAVVDPEKKGSITIYKYAVEDPSDFDTPAPGEEQTLSDMDPLPNISFTVTRVADDTEVPALANALTGDEAYTQTLRTDENGKAVFPDLNQGIYLIQEEQNSSVVAPIDDFLVSVPMTNPAGLGWLYDIYVYPKNQVVSKPDINVSVTEPQNKFNSVNLGEEIKWIVTSGVPKDIAEAKKYTVQIKQHQYFNYIADSITVYAKNKDEVNVNLEENTDYALSQADNEMSLTILPAGRLKLSNALNIEDPAFVPQMYIEYLSILEVPSDSWINAIGLPLSNTASLEYTNSLGLEYTSKLSDPPYVYTGGIHIMKVDAKTEEPLGNAFFKIYRTLSDANADTNAIPTPGGSVDWEAITDAKGNAFFYGLAYGGTGIEYLDGASDYYLVETKAPDGYNLLTEPEKVTITALSHLEGNGFTVRNNTGFTLPITGGIGTILFTVIGLLLIGTALYLYLRHRRDEYKL